MSHRYLFRSIHISWHIAALALGVLAGTTLVTYGLAPIFDTLAWLVIGVAFFVLSSIRRLRILLVISLLAGILIGSWRGAIEQKSLLNYEPYFNQTVHMEGRVHEDPSLNKQGDQRLQLKDLRINGQPLSGQIWVSTDSAAAVKRGDIVFLQGVLEKGFGGFAGSIYHAQLKRIERPYPGDVGRRVRDWFAEAVRKSIPEPQASLGLGFLTGQRSTLPTELDEQLQATGLTHAVVASGYNLTILVNFARGAFSSISKYLSTLAAGLMIAGFILVTGFSPSMSRAGLVAALGLAAWYWGRTIHPLVLLPFAAAITVLINPAYLWGDIGWYLSFAAFFGVLVVAPLLRCYFWGKECSTGIFKQIITDTAGAQLATLPIILHAFGQYAAYAILANMLVLPLIPLAMLLTFLTGVASLLDLRLSIFAAWPAQLTLNYITWIIERIADLPGAQVEIGLSASSLMMSYVILLLMCFLLRYKTGYRLRE